MKICDTCGEQLKLIAFDYKENASDCLLCKLKRRHAHTLMKIETSETILVDELQDGMISVGCLGAKNKYYLPKEYLLEKYELDEIFPLRVDMVLLKPKIPNKYSSALVIEEIKRKANYSCIYCNKEADTVDHFIPLSKNGTWQKDNLLPCCQECNIAKGDKLFSDINSTRKYIKRQKEKRQQRRTIRTMK